MKLREFEIELSNDKIKQIVDFALSHATHVVNKGRLPGSLEPEETAGLDYHVVSGEVVREKLSWLWERYSTEWMDLVSEAVGVRCKPCSLDTISVNINVLNTTGSRYEWHVDSDPYSGVLFLTDHDEADGGEFVIEVEGERKKIYPRRGKMVLFDGTVCPHGVYPLKTNKPRVTVVMVFIDPNRAQLTGENEKQYSVELYGH